jgi:putative nucleotidyltransferase with HDIG domain
VLVQPGYLFDLGGLGSTLVLSLLPPPNDFARGLQAISRLTAAFTSTSEGTAMDQPRITRADAEALLFEFTRGEALRKHGRAVEEAMRAYARWYGLTDPAEIETWGIVGLLHDFDYEQNPTVETHLHVGARILRERGYPAEIIEAICSHADTMNIPRDTPLKKAIYACDELVGFIGACVKVRPSRKIADLPVESVVKKLKDKHFARSVDRSYVHGGAAAVGRPLDEHIGFLIAALQPIADEIGL